MAELVFSEGAVEDIKDFSEYVRESIREKLEGLKEEPVSHEDSKLIRVSGREVYRLEIRDERGAELDHRAIYDWEDGKVRIFSVIDRDEGYEEEEISNRFEQKIRSELGGEEE